MEVDNVLKRYFEICGDIEVLENVKKKIREELEAYLIETGADTIKTSVGSVIYVNSFRETMDKKFVESVLTEEQRKQAFVVKESKYIKIVPVKEKGDGGDDRG